MRHAYLQREATAVIAKLASAPCMILCCVVLVVGLWACGRVGVWACGCVGVWVRGRVSVWACGRVGVWACGCIFGGGMIDLMGLKNMSKTFSTEFFDWRIPQSENSVEKS